MGHSAVNMCSVCNTISTKFLYNVTITVNILSNTGPEYDVLVKQQTKARNVTAVTGDKPAVSGEDRGRHVPVL